MTDNTTGGVLAFAPIHNSPGRRDASYFQSRAHAFVKLHGGRVVLFDDSKPMRERAHQVMSMIAADGGTTKLVCVAFFCHGWARGIEAGFDLRPNRGTPPQALAQALVGKAGQGLICPLYCCSTADDPSTPGRTEDTNEAPGGDGGFADMLRDALCKVGITNCRVDAHDTDGDTTLNPRVRRFAGNGSFLGGYGGEWIVPPENHVNGRDVANPLFRVWARALQPKDKGGQALDLEYPFLDTETIRKRLGA